MGRFLLIILCCCYLSLSAQPGQSFSPADSGSEDTILPKSFVIGEYEQQFEQLNIQHGAMLLSVCDDNMEVAFGKWLSMLKEMEAYATLIDYDIKGLKLWLNVFWDGNGKIKHIAYYPKPTSRNVNLEDLSAFFTSFINNYTFPLVVDVDYSHYGSASFPVFSRGMSSTTKN